jgi:thiol-disulfide isomerase/thioredoxin/tetratricopeptide (TPR) repeat protein
MLRRILLSATLALALAVPALGSAPAEDMQAPAFTLPVLGSGHFSLSNARGHVVVVNFFATWCPPCRTETPDLVAAEKRYAHKGVIFVGVDDREDPALVAVFAKTKGIRYPIVLDSDGAVSKAYDVRAIPTTYIVDRNGVIRYRQVDALDVATLEGALGAVLSGSPLPESLAAKNFLTTASVATSKIEASIATAKASTPPAATSLNEAIEAGTTANKKLDDMLARPDSDAVSYFEVTAARDKLNGALADAYALRGSLPDVKTATDDQTQAALLRGQVLIDQEQFEQASDQFDTAMKLSPKNTAAYDGAYMAAYERKDYAQAQQIASAEATLVPEDPESWLTVASAQNTLKNYSAALEAERKALDLAATAYAKNPTSKAASYELGRVWLKMARTQVMAGDAAAAKPLLSQSEAAAPGTIVAQQSAELLASLEPPQLAIESTEARQALGAASQPAKVFVTVRNSSNASRQVSLRATGLPAKWLLSFCYSTVCNPYKVSFELAAGGSKRIELLVAPLATTNGPWSMRVDATGTASARVQVEAKTANAWITIQAS